MLTQTEFQAMVKQMGTVAADAFKKTEGGNLDAMRQCGAGFNDPSKFATAFKGQEAYFKQHVMTEAERKAYEQYFHSSGSK